MTKLRGWTEKNELHTCSQQSCKTVALREDFLRELQFRTLVSLKRVQWGHRSLRILLAMTLPAYHKIARE